MNIGDIVALKIKGYSIADLKEIDKISKETPEIMELAKSGTSLNEINELLQMAAEPAKDDTNANTQPGDPQKKEPETTPETAELKKIIEEQKKQIETYQKLSQSADVGSVKSNEDKMKDLISDIMK